MCNHEGKTILHWAAKYGQEAVVKFLLDTGKVDVNCKDPCGITPLHLATMFGNERIVIVELLLDTGEVEVDQIIDSKKLSDIDVVSSLLQDYCAKIGLLAPTQAQSVMTLHVPEAIASFQS
ncbi:ankyrin [Penicillium angulare]|uniref:ankyrin n=1 Tax=Penicillium angulare TaxID=116970 RepID=UPI002540F1E4|nr:ankyrin [Penicillium angulare]KAJ5259515.1 ankyrin [Penicillium angulare]